MDKKISSFDDPLDPQREAGAGISASAFPGSSSSENGEEIAIDKLILQTSNSKRGTGVGSKRRRMEVDVDDD